MAFLRGKIVSGSSRITGSFEVSGSFTVNSSGNVDEFFLIKSGSDTILKVNNDGLMQFKVYEDNYNPTAKGGAILFTSSSVYLGLDN